MWVSDYVDDKIYAYDLTTKARDASKDFDTLSDAGNENPDGIWSNNITMWVSDYEDSQALRLQHGHQGSVTPARTSLPLQLQQGSGPTAPPCGLPINPSSKFKPTL